jgi:hypothetical protein
MPRGLNSTTAKCAEMGAEKISFSSGPFQDSNGSTDSDGELARFDNSQNVEMRIDFARPRRGGNDHLPRSRYRL